MVLGRLYVPSDILGRTEPGLFFKECETDFERVDSFHDPRSLSRL